MFNNHRIGKTRSLDVLACGIIIFSPFSNLSLQGSGLGILGASASFPFAFMSLFFIIAPTFQKQRINKNALLFLTYSFLITLAYSAFIKAEVNTENSYIKGTKLSILYLLALSGSFINIKNESLANKSCWIALIICAISLFQPLSEIDVLNYAGNNEGRPRGLTMESSHYALIVGSITTIIFHLEKSSFFKAAAVLLGLTLTIYSESKAGALLYCLSFFIYYTQGAFDKKSKSRHVIFFLLTLSLITLVAIPFFIERMQNDIDRYTSTATRVVGFVGAIKIALENPLGVGFSGYVEYYLNAIPKTITLVKSYAPYLDFTEVTDYTRQQNTQSLGTKSFFADSLIIFGIPFLLIYFYSFSFLYKKVKRLGRPTLIPGIVFVYLSLMFWTSGIGFYITFLVLSFIPQKNTIPNENTSRFSRPTIPTKSWRSS